MDAIVYDKVGKEAEKVRDALFGIYPQETITDAAVASFDDGADGIPVKALIVGIEPVQAGSGDPSPDNVRPISGWTGANIFNEVEYDAEATPKLSVSWESEAGTVYGGMLDVTSGVLTITTVSRDLGTLNWAYDGNYGRATNVFKTYIEHSENVASSQAANALCSNYNCVANDALYGGANNTLSVSKSAADTYAIVRINDTAYSDAATFKSAMSGVLLVYKRMTHVTYQLTPTEVTTLFGTNNIWADTGDVTKLAYRADLGMYINKAITASAANVLNS